MFKLYYLVLTFITSTLACGDNTYRCMNPNGSVSDDWTKTKECAEKLGLGSSECWCSHRAEWYIDVLQNADAFKKCCENSPNFSWREC